MQEQKSKIVVKLADRKIEQVKQQINQVLDNNYIYGQEWNKEIIKAVILDNLTKDTTIKLIEELNQLPISSWND